MTWNPQNTTNPFFNPYGEGKHDGLGQTFRTGEQRLIQDLVSESIAIYGLDFFYIPRILNNLEPIYLQDDSSSFEGSFQIPMYVKNYEGFGGEGNFMSKFGLQIRDQITFTVSTEVWLRQIGTPTGFARPREGDLVYYPLNNKVFQIKFVENKPIHYPLGILPTWDLQCELFEYSNEQFNTGIPELDRIWMERTTDIYDFALMDENYNVLMTEKGEVITVSDYNIDDISVIGTNEQFEERSDDFVDWDALDPFNDLGSTGCANT